VAIISWIRWKVNRPCWWFWGRVHFTFLDNADKETCFGQASLHNRVDDGGRPPGNQRDVASMVSLCMHNITAIVFLCIRKPERGHSCQTKTGLPNLTEAQAMTQEEIKLHGPGAGA